MFIINWWNSLELVSQAFACVAIPATLILLVQTILMLIGIGNESDGFGDDVADDIGDADADATDAPDEVGFEGLKVFSVRGIIAFFVVFGWVGLAMDATGIALPVTLVVYSICLRIS